MSTTKNQLTKSLNRLPKLSTVQWSNVNALNILKHLKYSFLQQAIIQANEPYIVVQAGAGVGKSYTIEGRLLFLEAQGVSLQNILVTSFTNVAADHLRNKHKGLNSRTMASICHDICHLHYPELQLSNSRTVSNALRLITKQQVNDAFATYSYNQFTQFINQFADILYAFDDPTDDRMHQTKQDALFDLVLKYPIQLLACLKVIKQTTLEIEPFIAHQLLYHNNVIPDNFQNLQYIITDESQDLSTSDYIVLLELVRYNQAQLMIVGDAAQTLYEFRSSDPAYLNTLESNEHFTCYKLNINYRSDQQILDVANIVLNHIDANKIAKMQLQSAKDLTISSKVLPLFIQRRTNNKKTYYTDLYVQAYQNNLLHDWIEDKIQKKEQIAFLAHSNRELEQCYSGLNKYFEESGQIVSMKSYQQTQAKLTTLYSTAMSNQVKDLQHLDPKHPYFIKQWIKELHNGLNKLSYRSNAQRSYFHAKLDKLLQEDTQNDGFHQFVNWIRHTYPTPLSGFYWMKEYFLQLECQRNNVEQNIMNRREPIIINPENNIVLITIHSAKGLEFPHTVVCYNDNDYDGNCFTDQERMRMLYVALTRSEKSELLLNLQFSTKPIERFDQSPLTQAISELSR